MTTVLKWYASCDECTMSHYTPTTQARLIMVFDDQYERGQWAKHHTARTGHHVLQYQRRLHPPPAYPTEPIAP